MNDGWDDVKDLELVIESARRLADSPRAYSDPRQVLAELRVMLNLAPEPERPPSPDLLYIIAKCAECGLAREDPRDRAPVMVAQNIQAVMPGLQPPPVDYVLTPYTTTHPHPTVWTASLWPEGDKERAVELKREERGPYPDYPRGDPDQPNQAILDLLRNRG